MWILFVLPKMREIHTTKDCKSNKCRKCEKFHNTLLHVDKQSLLPASLSTNPVLSDKGSTMNADNEDFSSSKVFCSLEGKDCTLLSTALVSILDKRGNAHNCRIILDSGSQRNPTPLHTVRQHFLIYVVYTK